MKKITMIKRITLFLLLTVLAIGLSSCMDEPVVTTGAPGNDSGAATSITTLPTTTPTTATTTPVTTEAPEPIKQGVLTDTFDLYLVSRTLNITSVDESILSDFPYDGKSYDESTSASKWIKVAEKKDSYQMIEVGGQQVKVLYHKTRRENVGQYTEVDRYLEFVYSDNKMDLAIVAHYDTATGTLVEFETELLNDSSRYFCGALRALGHDVPCTVTPASTEAEYVAYASAVLEGVAGVSTQGWQVKVTTEIAGTTSRIAKEGFVSYAQGGAEEVSYTITFYKTIGGIVRSDLMYVEMSSAGEVSAFNAVHEEEAFSPFVSLDFSTNTQEEIMSLIKEKETKGFHAVGSHLGEKNPPYRTTRELQVKNNMLWVYTTIELRFGNYPAMAVFAIKMAEIPPDDPILDDPLLTE